MTEKKGCIDPALVPCEKARAYLAKKGVLCQAKVKKKRARTKKSLWDWLFD